MTNPKYSHLAREGEDYISSIIWLQKRQAELAEAQKAVKTAEGDVEKAKERLGADLTGTTRSFVGVNHGGRTVLLEISKSEGKTAIQIHERVTNIEATRMQVDRNATAGASV